jgi:hypothetical protein
MTMRASIGSGGWEEELKQIGYNRREGWNWPGWMQGVVMGLPETGAPFGFQAPGRRKKEAHPFAGAAGSFPRESLPQAVTAPATAPATASVAL